MLFRIWGYEMGLARMGYNRTPHIPLCYTIGSALIIDLVACKPLGSEYIKYNSNQHNTCRAC